MVRKDEKDYEGDDILVTFAQKFAKRFTELGGHTGKRVADENELTVYLEVPVSYGSDIKTELTYVYKRNPKVWDLTIVTPREESYSWHLIQAKEWENFSDEYDIDFTATVVKGFIDDESLGKAFGKRKKGD